MTEAIYLLTDSEKKKQLEMGGVGGQAGAGGLMLDGAMGGGQASLGLMMNMNDDVIRKTRAYLDQFSQFKDFQVSKKMRAIAKQYNIKTELFITICDLGLRDYDEAVTLLPELKQFEKENVLELIDEVKNSNN